MESVEVNENKEKENEQENENEKTRLSEIDVIELYSNTKDGGNSNKCYKMILVIIVTFFILSLFFFISLKTVNIFYEDRTNIDNLKLNLNQADNTEDNKTKIDKQQIIIQIMKLQIVVIIM